MNRIHLLPVGKVDVRLLQTLCGGISPCLPFACEVLPAELNPAPAYHAERQQYHSSDILERMQALVRPPDWRLLGVTGVDLYIPILKYIFGEAQVGGPCALVSFHRLRQEYYGLEPDAELFSQRLLKESIHELGHTLSLPHCQDYRCAMASAHSVEWIDLREYMLCKSCRDAGLGSLTRSADGQSSALSLTPATKD
jgi:archaemetzincin